MNAEDGYEIAIVGMAGRFPGAASVDGLWALLAAGREAITFLRDEQLRAAGVTPELLREPGYVRARGVLDGVELFDADVFGFTALEAAAMDPQKRVFLECCHEALETAGHDPFRTEARVGVFAGAGRNHYRALAAARATGPMGQVAERIAHDPDFLTTTVSYRLGLRGPSIDVQTACSTSLVAVHLACQSLLAGESDIALAGGVSIALPQVGYLHQPGGIAAADGHCRAFDRRADGTVTGSGAGVVVLRRLEDARADGGTILAVLRGSAVNNDGHRKVGFAAPGVDGQTAVVREALGVAGVDPASVSYVEAHGTGTPLGDAVEVAALSAAFAHAPRGGCLLGSLKTNIGHLDAAAGVAGLIKVVLMLRHRQVPPSLHFETPGADVDLARSPFRVPTALRAWEADGPRRAGVSSFGVGGTNAHVIVEEAPAPAPAEGAVRGPELLVLSARSEAALEQAADALAAHLRAHPELRLADVAHTLRVGRIERAHRLALVADDVASAAAALTARDPAAVLRGVVTDPPAGAPASPRRDAGDAAARLRALAALWTAGTPIDGAALTGADVRRVPLPTYPFERRRHWIETSPSPAPSATPRVSHNGAPVAPGVELEETVAAVWRELFGLDAVGPHENFFELGGSSLLAFSLIAELELRVGREISLRDIFDAPTVAGIAACLARPAAPVARNGASPPLDGRAPAPSVVARAVPEAAPRAAAHVAFSLFFFSADGSTTAADKYRLLLDAARFADAHGFAAVWTPERHFQEFGGLYPNPSVLGAALAVQTQRIQIRAGSLVVPLHHPIRAAEEWAVVDNLSNGRVAVSLATGWHPRDFVLSPRAHAQRRDETLASLQTIRALWAGESVAFRAADGAEHRVSIFPRPIQRELPIWLSIAGNPQTWELAGALGANVLTGLVGQPLPQLTARIEAYRAALTRAGHDPEQRTVTVMLHTFVGADDGAVEDLVRAPMRGYLRSFLKQHETILRDAGAKELRAATAPQNVDDLLDLAFERTFADGALLGGVPKCARLVDALARIGVNEIACLVDFGLDAATVLDGLRPLDELRRRYASPAGAAADRG